MIHSIKLAIRLHGSVERNDYDRTSCRGCRDYCRCTQIINAHVTSVNFTGVADAITKNCTNELRNYCAERFLRHSGLSDLSSWEVNVLGWLSN